MNRVDETEKYFRKKLSQYSKETIINAIFDKFEFTTIDLLCHKCFVVESMKKAEQEERRETENLKRFESAVTEYNTLCKKAKEKGISGLSLKEIERMRELLKIIKKG